MTEADEKSPSAPESYPSRLLDGIKLWAEAGRASAYGDAIFIWIPKNAGTSIHAILREHGFVKLKTPRSVRLSFRNKGRVTFGHMAVGSLVDAGIVSLEFVAKAFKFDLTRDPYARAISLYRYLSHTFVIPNWHERPTFHQFLDLLADGFYDRIGPYNVRGLSQCSPQSDWLRQTPADKIYRVEDPGEFVADMSERLHVRLPDIPHLNKSSRTGAGDLAPEEKALIERIYAEDFDTFGYSKG